MQPPAHFLAGAATARYVRWRPLGIALALASHFALDAIPHFEDWSILPGWLAPTAGRYWLLLLGGTHLAAIGLCAWAWIRLLAAWRGDRRRVAYVIAAGVVACLPDYASRLCDPLGVVAWLNDLAHGWWFRPYLRAVTGNHAARPAIAFGCIAAELIVCFACGWLLFRALEPPDATEGATEQP